MEIISKAYVPRDVQGPVGVTQKKVVFRRGCLLQHCEENIEHCEPREGTMNIALSGPAFWVEGEVTDTVETRKIPLLEGIRGADDRISRVVEVDKLLGNV